jgi:hypothetical protein
LSRAPKLGFFIARVKLGLHSPVKSVKIGVSFADAVVALVALEPVPARLELYF